MKSNREERCNIRFYFDLAIKLAMIFFPVEGASKSREGGGVH